MPIEAKDALAVILASGASSRFKGADKLVYPYQGRPLGTHIGQTLKQIPFRDIVAIIGTDHNERARVYSDISLRTHINPNAHLGQGTSVAEGAKLAKIYEADALLICLADMPLVTSVHINKLLNAMKPSVEAVITRVGNITHPPILFHRSTFAKLEKAKRDSDGKRVVNGCSRHVYVDAKHAEMRDIDKREDLQSLSPEI